LQVAGKPILGHILDEVSKLEVSEVIIIINFFGEMIKKYVNSNYSLKVRSVEQEQLKGLGYAIHLAAPYFDGEPILIILGDTVYHADLNEVIATGENSIGTHVVHDPRRFGIAEVKNNKIVRLKEKPEIPTSNLAVVGIYYIRNVDLLSEALDEMMEKKTTTRGEYQLTDALQIMIDKGVEIGVFDVDGWYDCGKPETLLATNQFLLSQLKFFPSVKGSVIMPPVFISPTAEIINSVLGPNVSVADGAAIANSIIRDSIIGQKAEVDQCIMEFSLIGDYARVKMQYRRFNVGDSSEIGYS